MRSTLVAAILLVLGCSEHGRSIDATEPGVCQAKFQAAIDKTCTVPSDCSLGLHSDCCGIVHLGIRAGTEDSFAAAERELQTCAPCPPVGCAHQDQAEDGRVVTMTGQTIVPTCVANRCSSTVTP
jgi:hypothetical protein